VYGSRLANKADRTHHIPRYSQGFRIPLAPGGQIFISLRTDTATQWVALNTCRRTYAITRPGAFTTRKHMARGLVPSWIYLNTINPRNDGQIIARDAVIPRATLLGYANAGHWSFASTIESVHTFLGARPEATRSCSSSPRISPKTVKVIENQSNCPSGRRPPSVRKVDHPTHRVTGKPTDSTLPISNRK
jgi:hypothetical protein